MKEKPKPNKISADKARGGKIILKTRKRQIIFLGGLAGMVVIAIILRVTGLF